MWVAVSWFIVVTFNRMVCVSHLWWCCGLPPVDKDHTGYFFTLPRILFSMFPPCPNPIHSFKVSLHSPNTDNLPGVRDLKWTVCASFKRRQCICVAAYPQCTGPAGIPSLNLDQPYTGAMTSYNCRPCLRPTDRLGLCSSLSGSWITSRVLSFVRDMTYRKPGVLQFARRWLFTGTMTAVWIRAHCLGGFLKSIWYCR